MIRGTNKIPVEEQILNCIKKYELIKPKDRVVIGVSGGPDSICLLHALNSLKERLNFEIYVAHVNHMIRKEADMETEYVKSFCKKIGIECFVKKVNVEQVAKEEKRGTEETGRNIRYLFFNDIAKQVGANKIATAHNLNDKAETVLLNVIRGSGIIGLKGIEAKRDEIFIRPLIETSREDIEDYCKENKLEPKIDKTNLENVYKRNKIRNELIPYLQKEFNPNIVKTINRLSEVVTEENEYLEEVTKDTYKTVYVGAGILRSTQEYQTNINIEDVGADASVRPKITNRHIVLNLKKFNSLELVIKRRIILYTINKVIGNTMGIEKVNIDEIIKLCNNNIGNKFLTPTKNIKVLVKNSKIYFISTK